MVMVAASQGLAKLIIFVIVVCLSICSGQFSKSFNKAIGSRNAQTACATELPFKSTPVDLAVSILGAENLKSSWVDNISPFVEVRVSQILRASAASDKGIVLTSCNDGLSVYNTIPAPGETSPVWDETTTINSLPISANFEFRLWHQGYKGLTRYIGAAKVRVVDIIDAGEKSINIVKHGFSGGKLTVKVELGKIAANPNLPTRSSDAKRWRRSYSRYPLDVLRRKHFKHNENNRGYYVYEVDLRFIDTYFKNNRYEMYDKHKIAKTLKTPLIGSAVAGVMGLEHAVVNKRRRSIFGHVYDARGFFDLFEWGTKYGKPIVYTYCLIDGQIRFSETDPNVFYKNMVSKHLVLANVAREVVYAGEMFVVPADKVPKDINLPQGAISTLEDPKAPSVTNLPEGVSPSLHAGEELPLLVMDNGSGTFRPSKKHLGTLELVFRNDFPGIKVVALSFDDERLKMLRLAAGITTAMAS